MSEETTKTKESTTVRIAGKSKERLQQVARMKGAKEKRDVTEIELVTKAVEALCETEEKELGL